MGASDQIWPAVDLDCISDSPAEVLEEAPEELRLDSLELMLLGDALDPFVPVKIMDLSFPWPVRR